MLSDETRALYRDVVMLHHREPRNHGELVGATHHARGDNPLCGDRVALTLRVDRASDTIAEAMFVGEGCAISRASASLMTEAVRGRSCAAALGLADTFSRLVDASVDEPAAAPESLAAFSAVRAYPGRLGCATLAWDTLRRALAATQRRDEE